MCNIKQPTKFVESIKGKTIACFDELSILDLPKSQEAFKQLLSSQYVDVRLAWARDVRRYALRQGFCATKNPKKFIPDSFFSRRLWTIALNDKGRLDFDYLFANREDLWKEAVYYAENGEDTNLSFEEQKKVEETNKQFIV
jgi:predicted P-loop ATPase